MADILFKSASNSGYQTDTGELAWFHPAHDGDFIVVSVSFFAPTEVLENPDPYGISYGGTPLELIEEWNVALSEDLVAVAQIWAAEISASEESVEIVATLAGLNFDGSAFATVLSLVDPVSPVIMFDHASGTGSPAEVVLDVGTDPGYWVVDSVTTSDTSITVGADQTQRGNVSGALGSGGQSTETGNDPTGMSWTGVTGPWVMCAVALRPATSQTATPLTREITVTAIPPARSATGAVSRVPESATVTVSGTSPAASATGVAVAYPWTEFPASVSVTAVAPVAYGTGVAFVYPWTEFPANVTVSGVAPACSATGAVSLTPATATVTISAIAATGSPSGFIYRAPDVASATVSAIAPTATAQGVVSRSPGFALVTASGVSPDESGLGIATASPGVATVTIAGTEPTASNAGTAIGTPGAAAVTVSAADATVTPGTVTKTLNVAFVTLRAISPLTDGWIRLDCPCCPEDGSGSSGFGCPAPGFCTDRTGNLPSTIYITFTSGCDCLVALPSIPLVYVAANLEWESLNIPVPACIGLPLGGTLDVFAQCTGFVIIDLKNNVGTSVYGGAVNVAALPCNTPLSVSGSFIPSAGDPCFVAPNFTITE